MQKQFIRYIKILGISLCISLLTVGLINWVIDPYDDLGKNWIGVYTNDRREQIRDIAAGPYDAVIMGSSRPMQINPDDLCGHKFYNASFPGAIPEEMYYYLERYGKNLKLAVIGWDFYMFNDSTFPLSTMKKWPDHNWPVHEYLLGWNVLSDSIDAIHERVFLHIKRLTKGYSPLINEKNFNAVSYQWYLGYFASHDYANYHMSEERFEYLRKIKEFLDERHIKYIFFVNPLNEYHWRVLHLTGNYDTYLRWIERVQSIFPDLKVFPEGQYSQTELYYNNDPSHYLPVTGAMLLNELLGCAPGSVK